MVRTLIWERAAGRIQEAFSSKTKARVYKLIAFGLAQRTDHFSLARTMFCFVLVWLI